jgi:hypothetical protein
MSARNEDVLSFHFFPLFFPSVSGGWIWTKTIGNMSQLSHQLCHYSLTLNINLINWNDISRNDDIKSFWFFLYFLFMSVVTRIEATNLGDNKLIVLEPPATDFELDQLKMRVRNDDVISFQFCPIFFLSINGSWIWTLTLGYYVLIALPIVLLPLDREFQFDKLEMIYFIFHQVSGLSVVSQQFYPLGYHWLSAWSIEPILTWF